MRTTRSCVQLVCAALQRSTLFAHWNPPSETCATSIGPERSSVALNARCTTPNVPVHLLPPPTLQVLPFQVPTVSSQSSVTFTGPAFGASEIAESTLQLPDAAS